MNLASTNNIQKDSFRIDLKLLNTTIFLSQASHPSPGSPASGGSAGMGCQPGSPCGSQHPHTGKVKGSPTRKKSTSSTDEDDISNIPSLKMRIQVISQRVGA